jgi:hypothetical protein
MRSHVATTSTVQCAAVAGGLVAVALFHCIAIFAFYRGRVLSHWPISDSNVVVFVLPTRAAFVAYLSLLVRLVKHIGARLGCAALLTFLSGWASLFVSFNTYGT